MLNAFRHHTVLTDPKGEPVTDLGTHYYWCGECDPRMKMVGGDKYPRVPLDFLSAPIIKGKGNRAGFHKILKQAYGMKRLTPGDCVGDVLEVADAS